jgi:hypothetical protein
VLWLPTREGAEPELKLTISLDVEGGGWLVEMTTPSIGIDDEPVYSQILIPMSAIEQDRTDEYIDALFSMHLTFLGIKRT